MDQLDQLGTPNAFSNPENRLAHSKVSCSKYYLHSQLRTEHQQIPKHCRVGIGYVKIGGFRQPTYTLSKNNIVGYACICIDNRLDTNKFTFL